MKNCMKILLGAALLLAVISVSLQPVGAAPQATYAIVWGSTVTNGATFTYKIANLTATGTSAADTWRPFWTSAWGDTELHANTTLVETSPAFTPIDQAYYDGGPYYKGVVAGYYYLNITTGGNVTVADQVEFKWWTTANTTPSAAISIEDYENDSYDLDGYIEVSFADWDISEAAVVGTVFKASVDAADVLKKGQSFTFTIGGAMPTSVSACMLTTTKSQIGYSNIACSLGSDTWNYFFVPISVNNCLNEIESGFELINRQFPNSYFPGQYSTPGSRGIFDGFGDLDNSGTIPNYDIEGNFIANNPQTGLDYDLNIEPGLMFKLTYNRTQGVLETLELCDNHGNVGSAINASDISRVLTSIVDTMTEDWGSLTSLKIELTSPWTASTTLQPAPPQAPTPGFGGFLALGTVATAVFVALRYRKKN